VSHLTTIETKITSLTFLKQALDILKFKYVEGTSDNLIKVKGWNKESTDAILEIKTGGPYGIGVVENKETGTFEFIADWWGVETYLGENQETILQKISQQYAYSSVIDKVRKQGYTLVKETTDEDKNIRLVLRKWD
jgi:hypothetical protein